MRTASLVLNGYGEAPGTLVNTFNIRTRQPSQSKGKVLRRGRNEIDTVKEASDVAALGGVPLETLIKFGRQPCCESTKRKILPHTHVALRQSDESSCQQFILAISREWNLASMHGKPPDERKIEIETGVFNAELGMNISYAGPSIHLAVTNFDRPCRYSPVV